MPCAPLCTTLGLNDGRLKNVGLDKKKERCYLLGTGSVAGMFLLGKRILSFWYTVCYGSFASLKFPSQCMLWQFAPAVAVYGSFLEGWIRIFASTKLAGCVDYMVCSPAYVAILGAWFGAWPMPLDWERPWREWPICVTYGAMVGYVLGMLGSLLYVLHRSSRRQIKQE